MACTTVSVFHEGRTLKAIVCGPRPRRKRCACGALADWQCDWIIERHANGVAMKTCDRHVYSICTTKPEPDKDLCREHAEAFGAWLVSRMPA